MNCKNFQELIGMRCDPVGDAVAVTTPFAFDDGDALEIFAKALGPQVHFFDDGFTLLHLHSVGIYLKDKKQWRPLKAIAEANGVSLSDDGVFETLCSSERASAGFARLISTLLGVSAWAREQTGVAQDAAWFVDEVALYLHAWKPKAAFIEKPVVKGFSGRSLTFHFQVENMLVDAIQPHGASTGAVLRKVVDLSTSPMAEENEVMVVVDDRGPKAEAAKQELEIIGRVAAAWPMTALIQAAGGTMEARQ